MLDAIIIGTGPAGLSAAINLKLHNKDFLWFGNANFSDKVMKAERIMNYPGIPNATGKELCEAFRHHADEMGLAIIDKVVTSVSRARNRFLVLVQEDIYEAKTVLLATGVVNAAGYPGEVELLGHGVSYCATCDGFLYKGKTIAVICGAPRFEAEAKYLSELAETVYFFPIYKGATFTADNVITPASYPDAILGEKRVNGMRLKDGSELSLDGVFILRNAISPATLVKGLELDGSHIVVDRTMQTSIPGVFAAGDCTGRPYQYTKAVGEGNVAAHSMLDVLAGEEKENA